jgi:SIR2-like domain
MSEFDRKTALEHLRGQFKKGLPVLFTGAGFSCGAQDRHGKPLPLANDLTKEIWPIAFPGEDFDNNSVLQDVYHQAALSNPRALKDYLTSRLSVEHVPASYQDFYSAAWFRAYTVNVDDLPQATQNRYGLPRRINMVSALKGANSRSRPQDAACLSIVALHGLLEDIPEGVTFSRSQFAGRAFSQDPLYSQLAADLLSHPVVFIGSSMDEPLLWEHIEIRSQRGPRREFSELRPRSYLVVPELDRAKQALLIDYNVAWLRMTAEEFAAEFLRPLESEMAEGLRTLSVPRRVKGRTVEIPTVGELQASASSEKSAYLLGQEPTWSDLMRDLAITRSIDVELFDFAYKALSGANSRVPMLISGTAGSGKSTSLMRLALGIEARGIEVGWIDRDDDYSIAEVLTAMRKEAAPRVLAIDDADAMGSALAGLVNALVELEGGPLVIFAVRSGKVDRVLSPTRLKVEIREFPMPYLTDADIEKLLDLLGRENLLGILRGSSRIDQQRAFRDRAGRQLLVAMYEATSGRRFEEKVTDEYEELEGNSRELYAFISVAANFQYSLPQDELLLAIGSVDNVTLNSLRNLENRRLVIRIPGSSPQRLKARHRVVASVLVEFLQQGSGLLPYVRGLAWAVATKVAPDGRRSDHKWRILKKLMSHELLFRLTSVTEARMVYQDLEPLLSWDYHFWLQRASLEVEEGDLNIAENFLGQARGLSPEDPYVQTEWAYFLLKRATSRPEARDAEESANDAIKILLGRIAVAGITDDYPYHVLGSQGLAWARRGIKGREKRRNLLNLLIKEVRNGCANHPDHSNLKILLEDLTKEQLRTAVRKQQN